MQHALGTCFVLLAMTSGAAAQSTTFVVDDNPGPGVNFTDIASALSAANDGDIVLVREGNYAGFVLNHGVKIIGHGVVNTYNVRVESTTAGNVAVIAGMNVRQLDLFNCAGPVLFDDVVSTDSEITMAITNDYYLATVDNCADVRFHHCQVLAPSYTIGDQSGRHGMKVTSSRVELSSSIVRGGSAHTGFSCLSGLPGGTALYADASRLDIELTNLRGGVGSDGDLLCSAEGGDGGHGLVLDHGSSVVVAGIASNSIRGGPNGVPVLGIAMPGYGAYVIDGTLRWSGEQFFGGDGSVPAIAGSGGTVIHAVPDDPSLDLASPDVAGATMSFTFNGAPGDWSRLQQGTAPIVVDDGLAALERLDNRFRQNPLGLIPPSGVSTGAILIPPNAAPGWLRIFQGSTFDGTTGTLEQRTNSVFVIVR
jgi:hypothetical protein